MRNNSLILKSQMLGVLRLDRGRVHPLPPQHLGRDALPKTDLGHRSRGRVHMTSAQPTNLLTCRVANEHTQHQI